MVWLKKTETRATRLVGPHVDDEKDGRREPRGERVEKMGGKKVGMGIRTLHLPLNKRTTSQSYPTVQPVGPGNP